MDQETAKRVVFDAYVVSLPQARAIGDDRAALDAFLGDVDRQAGSMDMTDRMALAGRVFAASVALSGGPTPELEEVDALIDALLSYSRPQREEAAPLGDGRLWPEDEASSGLGELIADADEDELAEECATVASYLLQFGLRPSMDVGAALEVSEELSHIAREGQAVLDVAGTYGLASATPGALLERAAERARDLLERRDRTLEDGVNLAHGAAVRESWIHVAAALVAARARWAQVEPDWEAVLTRATERIASSFVYEDPRRFAADACAEHTIVVVIEAATSWLDEALQAVDGADRADALDEELDAEAREFIWEGLLEAASSGLVGAWVESRQG